jgi:hypothetical protein
MNVHALHMPAYGEPESLRWAFVLLTDNKARLRARTHRGVPQ